MTDQEKRKLENQIQKIRETLDEYKSKGYIIPKVLRSKLNILSEAINTGIDLGCAGWDTKKALEKFQKELESHCPKLKHDQVNYCQIEIDRGYLNRATKFTLDIENPNGLAQNFFERIANRLFGHSENLKACLIEKP